MNTVRLLVVLMPLLFLGACGKPGSLASFPPSKAAEWQLTSEEAIEGMAAPEPLRSLGVKRGARTRYKGEPEFSAEFYEMTSPTAAFEAIQKWRTSQGTMSFHQGSVFVVVHTGDAPRDAVSKFITAIEKSLE